LNGGKPERCGDTATLYKGMDYVWLLIEWQNDPPRIRWCDEWRVEDFGKYISIIEKEKQ
jgi:hypothetical protein